MVIYIKIYIGFTLIFKYNQAHTYLSFKYGNNDRNFYTITYFTKLLSE